MGRGSSIFDRVRKKIVEFKTLKTTFLNVKLQRLCKSHLQCITSSKDSEKSVGKHNPPCHLQMPTKALSCKKEAICEHGPEAPLCPVGQGSFKMDRFKSSQVYFIVNSSTCTVHTYRELKLRYSQTLGAYS